MHCPKCCTVTSLSCLQAMVLSWHWSAQVTPSEPHTCSTVTKMEGRGEREPHVSSLQAADARQTQLLECAKTHLCFVSYIAVWRRALTMGLAVFLNARGSKAAHQLFTRLWGVGSCSGKRFAFILLLDSLMMPQLVRNKRQIPTV